MTTRRLRRSRKSIFRLQLEHLWCLFHQLKTGETVNNELARGQHQSGFDVSCRFPDGFTCAHRGTPGTASKPRRMAISVHCSSSYNLRQQCNVPNMLGWLLYPPPAILSACFSDSFRTQEKPGRTAYCPYFSLPPGLPKGTTSPRFPWSKRIISCHGRLAENRAADESCFRR